MHLDTYWFLNWTLYSNARRKFEKRPTSDIYLQRPDHPSINKTYHQQMDRPSHSPQDTDYDADAEVVKPYAIEEPDDEPTNPPPRHMASSLPDNFERWHIDLIGSMADLQCETESNGTDSTSQSGQQRGKKRKPATTASTSHNTQPSQRESKHGDKDSQYEGPGVSRKRLRRRPRLSSEGMSLNRESSSSLSNSTDSYRSESSSAPQSTEGSGSGTETGNVNSTPDSDKMDVD